MPGTTPARLQPFPGYNFTVNIDRNASGSAVRFSGDNYFSRISGLSMSMGTQPIQGNAGSRSVYHLPEEISYEPLVLERGVIAADSPLSQWCSATMSMTSGGIQTATVIVYLLDSNQENQPSMAWAFYNAWPTKWEISTFDAQESMYVTESITFSYSYYQRIF